ncbi:unnamed protein product [Litomosoides sigmodontis]|uniref:Uncharacterized protein n=1 Tax=Litomosoides sigmodontis TaxID=42156 RepID=A0A3P6SJU3_LITSI|nr:unnamed protein product [Litomosoides sigmodontis]
MIYEILLEQSRGEMFPCPTTSLTFILIYLGTHQIAKDMHSNTAFTAQTNATPVQATNLSEHISTASENSSRSPHPPSIQLRKSARNFFTVQSKADKITIYFVVGVMFLTAAVNLALFLATLLHYLFPEDEGEKDEKK